MTAPIVEVAAEVLAVPLDRQLRAYGSDTVSVVLVSVRDRDGATGTGFTYTLGSGAGIVARMVQDVLRPALVGRPVEEWRTVRAMVQRGTRRLGAGVFVPALSAVDIAAWDLRGIQAGVPLHALLGSHEATEVPIYGSGRSSNELTDDELVEQTLGYLADGYPAVKVRAGARQPEHDLVRLAAVRRAVGEQVRLMVDCNEQLDLASALWLGRRLVDLDYFWMEEPLVAEDVTGYAMLAAQLPMAIAVGEHLPGSHAFAQYLQATSVSMYQPDAALGGGVTELLDIARLTAAHNRPISFHALAELHVHLAVAMPNTCYVEDFPILRGILAESLPVVDGRVRPPDRPGHGIRWDDEAIRAVRIAG